MTSTEKSDARCDPFFTIPVETTWNACIGPQSDEENYLDGYILAALELANMVIAKKMYAERDTLVLPILYTARHSVELALKFVSKQLHTSGAVTSSHRVNHDIESHWQHLCSQEIGDESLRSLFSELEPYIKSLASIDDDGQQLRYSEDRDGHTSLKDKPLANLEVIRKSLIDLQKILKAVKYRVLEFCRERNTSSFTRECSRNDLQQIAQMLPPRKEWNTDAFSKAKESIQNRYSLSSRKFSAALTVIEKCREMRTLIGLESKLMHLTDDQVKSIAEHWSKCHPPREERDGLGIDYFSSRDLRARLQAVDPYVEASKKLSQELSPNEVADFETIYYLGRDGYFPEYYEQKLENTKKEHALASNLQNKVHHLITKTNLLASLSTGIRRLGLPSLADDLLSIRPDIQNPSLKS